MKLVLKLLLCLNAGNPLNVNLEKALNPAQRVCDYRCRAPNGSNYLIDFCSIQRYNLKLSLLLLRKFQRAQCVEQVESAQGAFWGPFCTFSFFLALSPLETVISGLNRPSAQINVRLLLANLHSCPRVSLREQQTRMAALALFSRGTKNTRRDSHFTLPPAPAPEASWRSTFTQPQQSVLCPLQNYSYQASRKAISIKLRSFRSDMRRKVTGSERQHCWLSER